MGLSKPISLSSSDPRVLQTPAPPLPINIPILVPLTHPAGSNACPTRSQPRRRIPLQTAAASCVPWHEAHSRQLRSNGTRFGTSRLRRADRPLWTVNLDLHTRYRGTQPAVAYTRGNIGRKVKESYNNRLLTVIVAAQTQTRGHHDTITSPGSSIASSISHRRHDRGGPQRRAPFESDNTRSRTSGSRKIGSQAVEPRHQ